MTITAEDTVTPRQPSTGYLFSFALACLPFGFMGVALETGFAPNVADTHSIFSGAGTAGLLIAFAMLFAVRLIFWRKMPPATQALVRTIITGIFILSLAVSAILLFLCFFRAHGQSVSGPMTIFTTLSILCQISTVIWLIKYRGD